MIYEMSFLVRLEQLSGGCRWLKMLLFLFSPAPSARKHTCRFLMEQCYDSSVRIKGGLYFSYVHHPEVILGFFCMYIFDFIFMRVLHPPLRTSYIIFLGLA